jgi:hypothetical protein
VLNTAAYQFWRSQYHPAGNIFDCWPFGFSSLAAKCLTEQYKVGGKHPQRQSLHGDSPKG